MGDHRASIKVEFSMYGETEKADMWINWSVNSGECYEVDQRVIDFFRDAYLKMRDKYDDHILNLEGAPPQRQWVGLTDEEIAKLHHEIKVRLMGTYKTEDIYRAIEAKLKEKNS